MLKQLHWTVAFALFFLAPIALAETERPPLDEMPQAFQVAFWLNQAALAFNDKDHEDWAKATEKLYALRPYNQDYMTHLVRAYTQLGDFSRAYNIMLTMQQQGLAENWDEIDDVAPLREHRLYDHLNTLMKEAGEPFGVADRFATLPSSIAMPEAVAIDPASDRVFVGTVREGHILVTEDGEEWTEFATPDSHPELMAVFDLVVDSERGHLWVSTGAVTQFKGYRQADHGRTALLKLDLATGEQISVHRVIPDGKARLLGTMTLASDGTVYAADTRIPTVFRLRPEDQYPQPHFSHDNFTSLRGLTLSGDDRLLYVADYALGILVLSTEDATKAWKLAVPDTLNEGGIDGLYWWDNHLVAIQNGISPERIMRLQLGDDGLGVVSVAPVAGSLPEFDTPTYGTMSGSTLYFLSGSHWNHVDTRGRPGANGLPDIDIMSTDVAKVARQLVGAEVVERLREQNMERLREEQQEPEEDSEQEPEQEP
jgi:sugar lactone lactonase YvrE